MQPTPPTPTRPPTPELQLVKRQVLVSGAVTLVVMVLARLLRPGPDATATGLLIALSVAAFVAAVWSAFVRNWASFAGGWVLGFAALLVGGLIALEVLDQGALERMGAGGIVFIAPIMLGFFAFLLAGLIHFLARRGGRPRPPQD